MVESISGEWYEMNQKLEAVEKWMAQLESTNNEEETK